MSAAAVGAVSVIVALLMVMPSASAQGSSLRAAVSSCVAADPLVQTASATKAAAQKRVAARKALARKLKKNVKEATRKVAEAKKRGVSRTELVTLVKKAKRATRKFKRARTKFRTARKALRAAAATHVQAIRAATAACADAAPFRVNCDEQSSIPANECEALAALVSANQGAYFSGWGRGANPCDWEGITCHQGRVSELALGNMGLASLPTKIGNLTQLTRLDLGESPSRLRLGVRNPQALAPWGSALTGGSVARLVMIGSSSTDGTLASSYDATVPMKLQSRLRAGLGVTGGLGYVSAAPSSGGLLPDVPNRRSGTAVMWRHGLGGRSMFLSARSDHVTYASTPASRIRVYYGKTPSAGGGLSVFIDGVDQKVRLSSVSAKVNSGGHVWDSATLGPGNHVVKIVASMPGRVGILEGVEFINGDENSGVRVYNGAHSGATAAQYNGAAAALHWRSVAAIRPDLVTVMLGANDIADVTAADFLRSHDAMMTKIPSGTPILVLGTYLRGDYADAPGRAKWRAMQAGLAARAVGDVAYLDLAPYWPALVAAGSTSDGLMADTPPIHPSEAGRELLSRLIDLAIAHPSGSAVPVEMKSGRNRLTSLPAGVGRLAHLEFLDLSNNQLTSLPDELGDLTSLKVLDLRFNRLTGEHSRWTARLRQAAPLLGSFDISDGVGGNNCLNTGGEVALDSWLDAYDSDWDECG